MKRFRMWGSLALILALAVPSAGALAGKKPAAEPSLRIQNVNFDADGQQVIVKGKLEGVDEALAVQLRSAGSDAVLAELESNKQFGFKLAVGPDMPVPCAVEVSAGDLSATQAVRHAPADCGKYTRTITGLVTDGPVPFATVSVTLDGVTFTTTADAAGQYSLDIASTTLKKLVKIEASGTDPETGAPIDFVSYAGSFERLLSDEPQNVTNVTTASYVLAIEANGGTEPSTLEELQSAETAIDATELFQLAAVIKLLVDDPTYSLPAGYDNILDFVSDNAAVDAFVAAADPADLDQALADILADSNLVEGFTVAGMPDRYFAIPTANPGYLARSGSILEFDGLSQTGTTLAYNSQLGLPISQGFSWTVDAGVLVVSYDVPLQQGFSTYDYAEAGATPEQADKLSAEAAARGEAIFITGTSRTVETSYTRVSAGALVDVTATAVKQEIVFDPIELFASSPGEFVNLSTIIRIDNGSENLRAGDRITPVPFSTDCAAAGSVCVTGKWGGSFRYDPLLPRFFDGYDYPTASYGEVMVFTDTGGVREASGLISGLNASWSVADQRLVIDYGDGWTQTSTIIDTKGIEYGVFNEYSNGSERYADYNIFVKSDGTFSFTEPYLATGPDKFWNGEINAWIPGQLNPDGSRPVFSIFGWTFDPSTDPNTGVNQFGDRFDCTGDGNDDDVLLFRTHQWTLEADRLRIDRFPGLDVQRYWYPIAAVVDNGERQMYVMEVEYRFGGHLFPARLNIEREIDTGTNWTCTIPW